MTVSIDAEMQKFIDEKVASGQYASAKEVLEAALAALQLQDAYGDFGPGELDELIAEGERSIRERGVVSGQAVFEKIRKRDAGGSQA